MMKNINDCNIAQNIPNEALNMFVYRYGSLPSVCKYKKLLQTILNFSRNKLITHLTIKMINRNEMN